MFDSNNISAGGGTYQRTFDTVGTYDYACPLHSGMTGQIVVEDSYSLPSGTEDFTVSSWIKTTQAPATVGINEDFTTPTYTWTQGGNTDISITGGEIVSNSVGSAESRVYTPTTISDDKWILQHDYEVTRIGTDSEHSPFVVSAGTDAIRQTSMDYIGYDIYNPSDTVRLNYRDGTTNGYGGSFTPQLNTPYYVTMMKDGTTVTLSFFTDSARTTHETGSPITMTVPATVVGMTHIQSTGWVGSDNTGRRNRNRPII
mgnify:CR=1 FL=1